MPGSIPIRSRCRMKRFGRLHLKTAWRTYIPTDGRRDGLLSVQILSDQILVQTRSGMLVSLNPLDGSAQWRAAVGLPYRALAPAAINGASVIVYNGARLYSLDRKTGQLQWDFAPPNGPAAGPVANDRRLFLTLNTGLLDVYELPERHVGPPVAPPAVAPGGSQPGEPAATSGTNNEGAPPAPELPRTPVAGQLPRPQFGFRPGGRLERTPRLAEDQVLIADTTGIVQSVHQDSPAVRYRIELGSPVSAPMGQFGNSAYVATLDQHVIAINMAGGAGIEWRFLAAAPVRLRPIATAEDVYVTAAAAGLHRVNRQTGQEIWRNPGAGQFLAANKTLVYARDVEDVRLLIIDRVRGTTLTSFPIRDFVFPISNEVTDRLFIAANDGSLICLHDQAYPAPLSWQPTESAAPQPPPPVRKPTPEKPPASASGNEKPSEK